MKRVLMVCTGNICRSPAAEGVLCAQLERDGLGERVAVESAATTDHHIGERADPRMRRVAAARGYRLDSRARAVAATDFEHFDWIIAMDRGHLRALRRGDGRAVRRLFGEFLDPASPPDVPDPYYGGDAGFESVLDLLEAGCPALIEALLRG